MGALCLVLVLSFSDVCPSSFTIILLGKNELVTLLCISSWYSKTVTVSLPRGDIGWYPVCDCGIS